MEEKRKKKRLFAEAYYLVGSEAMEIGSAPPTIIFRANPSHKVLFAPWTLYFFVVFTCSVCKR